MICFFPDELTDVSRSVLLRFDLDSFPIYVKEKDQISNNEVMFQLEIPSINLKEDVYIMNSVWNDVNYHVELLEDSDLSRNILFLAAHSGNGSSSYFNDLVMLEKGDIVLVEYTSERYYYEVEDIYSIVKNGYMKIENNLRNVLYLITCSLEDKKRQIVVQSRLIYRESFVN